MWVLKRLFGTSHIQEKHNDGWCEKLEVLWTLRIEYLGSVDMIKKLSWMTCGFPKRLCFAAKAFVFTVLRSCGPSRKLCWRPCREQTRFGVSRFTSHRHFKTKTTFHCYVALVVRRDMRWSELKLEWLSGSNLKSWVFPSKTYPCRHGSHGTVPRGDLEGQAPAIPECRGTRSWVG